jgi:hypothetical protein
LLGPPARRPRRTLLAVERLDSLRKPGRAVALRFGHLAIVRGAAAAASRDRDGYCEWRVGRLHDLLCEGVDARARASRAVAQHLERVFDRPPEALAEDAFGLLDRDPRAERRLELVDICTSAASSAAASSRGCCPTSDPLAPFSQRIYSDAGVLLK